MRMNEPERTNRSEHETLGILDFAYRRLFQQRMVFLRGEIKDSVADDVAAQLLALDAQGTDDITLYVDSPGGDVTGLFAIHDTVQMIESTVHTRCVGMAASSAAVILATGTGDRSATPNARILIHQPHGGIQGTARDIEIHAKEFAFLRERVDAILAERTGQPIERIRQDTDRDFWLTPEAAKDYGLIDTIVGARPRLVP
jgi:ATP-dependent Clp protease protease subunit